jgi:internalin A
MVVDGSVVMVENILRQVSRNQDPVTGALLSDLEPLRNLVNLEALGAWQNAIADLTPLAQAASPPAPVRQLKDLRLGGNQIADISPLRDLQRLEILELYANQVATLDSLGNVATLRELNVGGVVIAYVY